MDCEQNLVLAGTARRHYWKGSGGFSIKSFQGGMAYYRIGSVTRRVDPGSLFLINHGVEYEIEIDAPKPVSAFCLFFSADLLPQAWRGRTRSADWLLDHPQKERDEILPMVEQLHDRRIPLGQVFGRVQQNWKTGALESAALEEAFHDVADAVAGLALDIEVACQGLPPTKTSTKREIYRRSALARDYIHSHWEEPITLARIARAASLSTSHLLRVFRMVYGVSPGQYLQRKRLSEAVGLLRKSSDSVSSISLACGFESIPSFSRLFRERFGLSPRQYRKMIRSDKSWRTDADTMTFDQYDGIKWSSL